MKQKPCILNSKFHKGEKCPRTAEECVYSHTIDFNNQEEYDRAAKAREARARQRSTSAERRGTGAAKAAKAVAAEERGTSPGPKASE